MTAQENLSHTHEKPSVWIACLSAYNEGILHGKWVDVPETVEELQEMIDEVIKSSPAEGAEEWAFHDNSGFKPFTVDEWESLDSLVMKANVLNGLEDYERDAFEAWEYQEYKGDDENDIIERFRSEYMGTFYNEETYASELFNECYEIPENIENYIDYSKVWRDLTFDGYYSAHAPGCEVHIFLPEH